MPIKWHRARQTSKNFNQALCNATCVNPENREIFFAVLGQACCDSDIPGIAFTNGMLRWFTNGLIKKDRAHGWCWLPKYCRYDVRYSY